ncbi:DUF5677 domain-containing protein [Shinella kummerowiae]|uniref:DUF5677 domain-containing protein n=1 Tax=Shinella kummerowiae TaxID=417745 RepID=UPI0021B56CFC|nr:DUF5677 domain-containing protein [Shinella kummerowiae]MCT7663544.1 DUF5677 domain-containing protein [Shinella kummerowiae]
MTYPDEIYIKMRSWAEQGLILLREILPSMAPVAQYEGWSKEGRETLAFVLSANARSSESALLLIAFAQLWDAEMLVRSVMEGTFKFCYLLQNRENFEQRHREYSDELFQIALFKDHKKVSELLSIVPNPNDLEWRPLRDRLLSEDEEARTSKAYNATVRRALESRWGFTGLLGELSRSGDNFFCGVGGYAHNFSIASHILHADYTGVSLALDRERRPPAKRDAMLLAHAVRLISDVLECLRLRLMVGYRFVESDTKPVAAAANKIDRLLVSFGDVYKNWMAAEYGEQG